MGNFSRASLESSINGHAVIMRMYKPSLLTEDNSGSPCLGLFPGNTTSPWNGKLNA